MEFKPESVNILGKTYKIIYCDNLFDVDKNGRSSLWGQVDFWDKEIRLYDKLGNDDIVHNLLHEILHAIVSELNIRSISNSNTEEDDIDMITLALADIFIRNNWLNTT